MVELPGVPRRFVVTQAPQSSVSARDVAGPSNAFGSGMQALASGIEEGLAPVAQEAGKAAVSRDADGKPYVDRSFPIFGRLGEVFGNSARAAFAAQTNSTLQTDLQTHTNKFLLPVEQGGFGGDVDAWSKAGEAYVKQRAANYRGGDQTAVLQEGMQILDQYRRGVLNTKLQKDTISQRDTINARMDSLATDMANLAFDGGTKTDAFQKAWAERQALRATMTGDPRFNYTQAESERDARRDLSMMEAESITGVARRSYEKDGNLARAQADAEKALNELPGLKPEEKIAWLGKINSHLVSANAARAEHINDLKEEAGSLAAVMTTTGKWDDKRVDSLAAELRANRQFHAASVLEGARTIAQGAPAIRSGTADEATATFRKATGVDVPSAPGTIGGVIEAAAARHGEDPALLKKFAQIESRFDPNAVNKSVPYDKAAKGLFQFIPSTWKQYGGGANPLDANANADAAARLLKANRETLTTGLGRPPTDGELYLAHQQGAAGAMALLRNPNAPAASVVGDAAVSLNGGWPGITAGQFAQLWTTKYDKTSVSNRVNAAVDAWRSDPARSTVIREFQTLMNTRTREAWKGITDTWDAGPGYKPTDQQLADLSKLMPYANDETLRKEIRDRLELEAKKGTLAASGATLQQLGDVFRQFDEAARDGLASPADVRFIAAQKAMNDKREKMVADYPADYGRNFLDKRDVGDVPQIFYGSPDTFAASMAARARAVGLVKQVEPQAGDNPFLMGEQGTIAKMLPNMPAAAAQGLVQAMVQEFSPVQLRAAMKDPDLKAAVLGLTKSMDPARMKVGFDLLDKLDRDNPVAFKTDFPGTDKQLDIWKAKTEYLPPDEVVRQMRELQSPAARKAREEAEAAGQKLVEKWGASDVAGQFDGWVVRNTPRIGTQPPVSAQTPVIQGEMVNEWKDLFSTYWAELGDETQAKELATKRLAVKWGQTTVGSMGVGQTRVMPNPPERYFPAIDGSHDWINRQLNEDVIAAMGDAGGPGGKGVRTQAFGVPLTPEQQTAHNKATADKTIVTDNQTQADIAAGRPPSYQVVVELDGRYQVLTDATGKTLRFRPDPKAGAAQRADRMFLDTRAGMSAVRQENEALFGSRDGPPGPDTRGSTATTGGGF